MKNLLGPTIRVSCRSAISLSLSLHITPLNKKTTHNLLTQSHNFTHNVFAFTNFTYAFVLISFNIFTYYASSGCFTNLSLWLCSLIHFTFFDPQVGHRPLRGSHSISDLSLAANLDGSRNAGGGPGRYTKPGKGWEKYWTQTALKPN